MSEHGVIESLGCLIAVGLILAGGIGAGIMWLFLG